MPSRKEPLTNRERSQLQGYVSWDISAFRVALFVIAVAAVGALCWRVQRWVHVSAPVWWVPTLLFAAWLYKSSRRWTGGRELYDLIRLDLRTNTAVVHHLRVRDAIVFEENEDEGPVVFVRTDSEETLVFTGQELARKVARGFPWREFELRESAHARRFLGMKRLGESLTSLVRKPPLSLEQYRRLELGSVHRWKRLDIPFEHVQELS